jgi:hypothetical protein
MPPDDGPALDPAATSAPASPAGDQGGDPAVEPSGASKPPRLDDPALLQRAYTQSQQRWSDLRKGLGLPKDATPEDVLAAVEAARAAQAAATDDDDDDAPAAVPMAAVLEAEARAEAAEWRYQAALYPETADAAHEFAVFARTEKDPAELTMKFYEILNRFAGGSEGAGEAEPPGAAAAAVGSPVGQGAVDVGMGDGPAVVSQEDAAALESLRGSGRVAEGLRHIPGWNRIVGA